MTKDARSNQAPVASLPPPEAATATEEEEERQGRRRAETSSGDNDGDDGDRASKVVVGRHVLFAPQSDALAGVVVVVARGRAVSIIERCILEKAVVKKEEGNKKRTDWSSSSTFQK